MLVVARLTYRLAMEEVEKHTPDHRAYLRTLHEQGKLLASGPFLPRTGGMLLLRVDSRDEADLILADDPFLDRGVVTYDVQVWSPTIGGDALESLKR